jgi:hypothetical protein
MSFDLLVFPPYGPRTLDEVHRLLAEDERRLRGGNGSPPPPGPEMARFLAELERRWPSLEEDPDGSPWSSWPLWQPTLGGGTGLSIRWSQAEVMRAAILDIARSANVIVYDQQSGEVISPDVG